MPAYTYKARDTNGKKVSGSMEAQTKTALIDKLQQMGYITTSVAEYSAGLGIGRLIDKLWHIRSGDLLMFYVQFSNMITSGLTVLMSLNTLAKQTENTRLREAIGRASRQVEAGSTLSQAFASQPDVFPKLFMNMIKAGEASGALDTVLMRYADFYEKEQDLKEKVSGALFYPLILLCAGIAVIVFIVTFVIPQFAEIYLKAGVRLPLPTLIVYKTGMAIKIYWYMIIIAAIAAIIGVRAYLKTNRGQLLFDTLKLRLPIAGPLYRKVTIARITRTLATLLGSGVAILESLEITKEVTGNVVFERVMDNVREYVEKGEKMSEPLKISGEFPPDVVQMVSVGEETGAVDAMLNKIADFYDMTVSYSVKKLTAVIEPIFLAIMGAMIGMIMASMLLPMFDMVKTLRH